MTMSHFARYRKVCVCECFSLLMSGGNLGSSLSLLDECLCECWHEVKVLWLAVSKSSKALHKYKYSPLTLVIHSLLWFGHLCIEKCTPKSIWSAFIVNDWWQLICAHLDWKCRCMLKKKNPDREQESRFVNINNVLKLWCPQHEEYGLEMWFERLGHTSLSFIEIWDENISSLRKLSSILHLSYIIMSTVHCISAIYQSWVNTEATESVRLLSWNSREFKPSGSFQSLRLCTQSEAFQEKNTFGAPAVFNYTNAVRHLKQPKSLIHY